MHVFTHKLIAIIAIQQTRACRRGKPDNVITPPHTLARKSQYLGFSHALLPLRDVKGGGAGRGGGEGVKEAAEKAGMNMHA